MTRNNDTAPTNNTDSDRRRLIPLTEWPKHHSWPPIGGLRYLVFHSGSNGFNAVIRRVGKRVLIDEQRFFDWADKQGGC